MQLTVRNTSLETREILLNGITRIAENMGRVAGLPEDKLPEVIISNESVPPTINDARLARRLKQSWSESLGDDAVVDIPTKGMGAEDFPFFTVDPNIGVFTGRLAAHRKRTSLLKKQAGLLFQAIIHRYLKSRRSLP